MDSKYQLYQELLQEIFGNRDDLLPLRPKDIEMIHEVLKKRLSSREFEAIQMRFRFGEEESKKHTYQEIGEKFDVTKERVRQICAKAIRILRHPANSRELRWLFRDALETDFAKTRDNLVEASKAVGCLKDFEGVIKDLRAKSDPDTNIRDLDLSPRAYNCLRNANIETLRELSSWPENRVHDIRNLGEATMNEIKKKLAQFGLQLAEPL